MHPSNARHPLNSMLFWISLSCFVGTALAWKCGVIPFSSPNPSASETATSEPTGKPGSEEAVNTSENGPATSSSAVTDTAASVEASETITVHLRERIATGRRKSPPRPAPFRPEESPKRSDIVQVAGEASIEQSQLLPEQEEPSANENGAQNATASDDPIVEIEKLLEKGDDVGAHRRLSELYWSRTDLRSELTTKLHEMAKRIYFSPQPHYLDPYVVQPGDTLQAIARKQDVTWEYLALLNRVDPRKIRPGQKLKRIKGPFHAIIDLSDFEITIHCHGYFVARYPVGIGKDHSTPVGKFQVRDKLKNPTYYGADGVVDADDPRNPLGEYWIDLGDSYGIHGTINPDSVGKAMSKGCVRLRSEDIEQVYLLLNRGSEVTIRE